MFKLASFLSHYSSSSLLANLPYFYWWEVPLWTDLICYGEVGSQRIQALILFVQRLTSLQQSSHPHCLGHQWIHYLWKKLPLDLKYHICSPLIHWLKILKTKMTMAGFCKTRDVIVHPPTPAEKKVMTAALWPWNSVTSWDHIGHCHPLNRFKGEFRLSTTRLHITAEMVT